MEKSPTEGEWRLKELGDAYPPLENSYTINLTKNH